MYELRASYVVGVGALKPGANSNWGCKTDGCGRVHVSAQVCVLLSVARGVSIYIYTTDAVGAVRQLKDCSSP